jgi:hypothetical protein
LVDNNRKLAPVQNICKWKLIVVGNNNWNASIMYGITYPSSVHLITFDMEAILAPLKSFFIRKR